MNKIIFQKQINQFLDELNARKQEVLAGNLDCTKQIGKNLFDFARNNFKDDYKLVYSTGSVRLDYIFHLGEKKTLHNASNFENIKRLSYALKYEVLANKSLYTGITKEDFYYVYWGYLTRLMKNFNFSSTYNYNEHDQTYHAPLYLQWMDDNCTNLFSQNLIDSLYHQIFELNDNTVRDINGDIKKINIKNTEYNVMKRLSKSELINLINEFEEKPTVKQLVDHYTAKLTLIDTDTIEDEDEYYKAVAENNKKLISAELMRKYVKEYELQTLIKQCNHSEKFKNKQNSK